MKNILFVSLCVFTFCLSGCADNSVKQIKADYIDIGFGDSLYHGEGKIDEETLQSIVEAYNAIEYTEKTSQEINYENAITVTFVYKDKNSEIIVIDENGIFENKYKTQKYGFDYRLVNSNSDFYKLALKIYEDIKKQY